MEESIDECPLQESPIDENTLDEYTLDEITKYIIMFIEENLSRLLDCMCGNMDLSNSVLIQPENDIETADSPQSEKNMVSYTTEIMLSSINLFNQIISVNIEQIMNVLLPEKQLVVEYLTGNKAISDVIDTIRLDDSKMQEIQSLAVSLYENNLLSMDYENRLIHFVICAVRNGLPDDDPFNNSQVEEWLLAHPCDVTNTEISAFEAMVKCILNEHKLEIQQLIRSYIEDFLKTLFQLSILPSNSTSNIAF